MQSEVQPIGWSSLALSLGLLCSVLVAALAPTWLWPAASRPLAFTATIIARAGKAVRSRSPDYVVDTPDEVETQQRLRCRTFADAVERWLHGQTS